MFTKITEKSAETSAAPLPESASGSALIFSKCERERERVLFLASERERVRHFEERANALFVSLEHELMTDGKICIFCWQFCFQWCHSIKCKSTSAKTFHVSRKRKRENNISNINLNVVIYSWYFLIIVWSWNLSLKITLDSPWIYFEMFLSKIWTFNLLIWRFQLSLSLIIFFLRCTSLMKSVILPLKALFFLTPFHDWGRDNDNLCLQSFQVC